MLGSILLKDLLTNYSEKYLRIWVSLYKKFVYKVGAGVRPE
jgi:hypothetical protein